MSGCREKGGGAGSPGHLVRVDAWSSWLSEIFKNCFKRPHGASPAGQWRSLQVPVLLRGALCLPLQALGVEARLPTHHSPPSSRRGQGGRPRLPGPAHPVLTLALGTRGNRPCHVPRGEPRGLAEHTC